MAVLYDVAPDTSARTAAGRTASAEAALRASTGRPDIALDRRPSGRPRLAPPYPELGVSLSHRDGLLLAAFSPTHDVGTDLEVDAPDLDPHRLAADHFTRTESAAIAGLPTAAARDLFLRLWVAKEAALKLTGRGVFDGLAEPDLTAHIRHLRIDGAIVALPARALLPALRLAVCRIAPPGRPAMFCGLAVAT